MVTKELLKAEIDKVSDERLDELYSVIQSFTVSEQEPKESLMSQLRQITIEAPEDFSINLDLYLSGEKKIE